MTSFSHLAEMPETSGAARGGDFPGGPESAQGLGPMTSSRLTVSAALPGGPRRRQRSEADDVISKPPGPRESPPV